MKSVIGLSVLICMTAFAQDKQPAAVGGGHLPARGPAVAKSAAPALPPAKGQQRTARAEHVIAVDEKGHPGLPHVDVKDDRWVGHDIGASDPRYHLDRPWAHGRYTGGFGPQQTYVLELGKADPKLAEWLAIGLERASFGGFYWNFNAYDYNIPRGWKWNGDRVAIYEDPVHVGWYLAYNPRLGTYTHVEYLGKVVKGVPGPETTRNLLAERPAFENDQVIINLPHAKMHEHLQNRVMIYTFRGGEYLHYLDGRTVDLSWQANEVKWSPASGLHYSEIAAKYANNDPPPPNGVMGADIGIKKPGVPGKLVSTALDPLRADSKNHKLEFENSQVRVIRVKMGPRQSLPMHEYTLNHVVFYFTDQNVRETSPDGKAKVAQHKAGDFSWDAPAKRKVDNLNDKPFEALVVEVKN